MLGTLAASGLMSESSLGGMSVFDVPVAFLLFPVFHVLHFAFVMEPSLRCIFSSCFGVFFNAFCPC